MARETRKTGEKYQENHFLAYFAGQFSVALFACG
jgi:hypothetical protein